MARANGDVVITIGGDVSPLTESVTRAERTLDKLNATTKRSDAEFRKLASTSTELQARINALTGVTERTGKSAEKAAQAFEEFDKSKQAVDRLRASYDPLFAASKRYEAAVETLETALRQGVITQQQYASMAQKLGASMLTMSGQQRAVAKGSSALTMQVQNASYQVGDFFVQIASGTGATRALAQQLPQLLGGFGMWGAVAGAAVAIGGALVPVFANLAEKAKDYDKAVEALADTQRRLNDSISIATMPLGDLIEKYGMAAGRVRQMAIEQMRLNVAVAKGALGDSVAGLTEATKQYLSIAGAFSGQINPVLVAVQKDFGLTGDAAWELIKRLRQVNEAATSELRLDQFRQLVAWLDAAGISLEQMPPAFAKAAANMLNLNISAEELAAAIDDANAVTAGAVSQTDAWASAMAGVKAQIVGIASALQSIGGGMIANAAKKVEIDALTQGKSIAQAVRLRKEYELAAEYAQKEAGAGSLPEKLVVRWEKAIAMAGLNLDDQLAALQDEARKREAEANKKGNGGKGKENELKRNLERLQKDFAAEQELLAMQHEEKLETLRNARNAELLTEQEFHALKLAAEAEFNEKMKDLQKSQLQQKLDGWAGAFGDLSSLMNTENKKLFNIGKAAAIAGAVLDGWSAAISSFEKGAKIGGPQTGYAFAAMSLAKTGVMLAQLKSTQFNGGGGGSAGGGASAPAAPAQSQSKVANYQIAGTHLGQQSTSELFKSINQGIKDGYTIYNVEFVSR